MPEIVTFSIDMPVKPCPFCGCEFPKMHDFKSQNKYKIVCSNCGARTDIYSAGFDAVDAWNRRVKVGNERQDD